MGSELLFSHNFGLAHYAYQRAGVEQRESTCTQSWTAVNAYQVGRWHIQTGPTTMLRWKTLAGQFLLFYTARCSRTTHTGSKRLTGAP